MKASKQALLILLILFLFPILVFSQATTLRSPEDFFGFKPGTDRKLIDYEGLIRYLQLLETSSPRIKLLKIGESPMGKPMYIAFISSENNIRSLDRLKEINKQLALNPDLTPDQLQKYIAEGKVFFLATLSMHSTEVAPSQSAPLIAYDLATTSDQEKLGWLDNVVYMMVPCHNPDGMDMVVDYYRKTVGTNLEGTTMPGIYHKYTGHDNNRDFISLTQSDTKAIAAIYIKDWFPQVMVEKHQMGQTGVRYYLPPPHDPIAENVDAGIWNWIDIFGTNMMKDMTGAGLKGISQNYLYDDYWPGSTETCIWNNVIGFLTEGASANIATPVFIEENELSVTGKGLSEYKKSINFPEPWKGGWWRLGDLVNYEITSTQSILRTATANKNEILSFRNKMCRSEVEKGKNQPPYFYILPLAQHDQSEMAALVNLLMEQGINVYTLKNDVRVDRQIFSKGSVIIPLAQPYRSFIKEVMERQKFPVRHYFIGAEVMKPYDIASWSLPLHRGVESAEISEKIDGVENQLQPVTSPYRISAPRPEKYWAARFPVTNNESFKAAFTAKSRGLDVSRLNNGDFLIIRDNGKASRLDEMIDRLLISPVFIENETDWPLKAFTVPRIALVETMMQDIDAGWTRFIFDTYSIPYKTIRPGDFEKTLFSKDFDVVVFPGDTKSVLMEGRFESDGQPIPTNYPPEATKGMGKKGMARLMDFIGNGGTVISWGASTELFTGLLTMKAGDTTQDFRFPVNDISKTLLKDGLFCPGSLVKLTLVKDHPLTAGMGETANVFFNGSPVFTTSMPNYSMDRRVIAKFPEEEILQSGYCEKPEKLANKSSIVWLRKDKGQVVLFGFDPIFRASVQGTYKLLFNALLLESPKE